MAIGVVAIKFPETVLFRVLHWLAVGQQASVGACQLDALEYMIDKTGDYGSTHTFTLVG